MSLVRYNTEPQPSSTPVTKGHSLSPMNIPIVSEAPNPSPHNLARIQQAATILLGKKFDRADITSWAQTYISATNKQRRIAFDLDYVTQYAGHHATILECGAIPLVLTLGMKLAGYQTVGIDLAPERCKSIIAEQELDIRRCDLESERLPLEDNSCDLVVFNEIFEHLRIDPVFTLTEVLRTMKPGGRLLLSSPNLKSLDGIVNFLLHDRSYSCCGNIYEEYQKLADIGHMGHVREYTPRELTEFLQRIGFAIEKIIFRGGYRQRWKQMAARFFPRLRPFMTIVAGKSPTTKKVDG